MNVVLLTGMALVVSAPALKSKRDDLLTGRWITVRCVFDGKDLTEGNTTLEYIFRGDGEWITYREGKVFSDSPGRYVVDPYSKPGTLDLIPKPDNPLFPICRGIYRIDGDTLTWHQRSSEAPVIADRPKGFDPPEKAVSILVMRRVVPK